MRSSSTVTRTTATTRIATAATRCISPIPSGSGATRRPDGSFSQFTRVQAQQLMPRPKAPDWEESACYTLTLATAYRMLFGHHPHELKPGQNVLVWGASGGLGSYAIQLNTAAGANAIGVISDEDKRDFVMDLGAKGVLNRKDFNCWGQLPRSTHRNMLTGSPSAQVRQGDLGHHRQGQQCRYGLRTPRRSDVPSLDLRLQEGRHGRDLCRHTGL
jgi:NADPH:quinone reductase-like Zn-dependent oxidoreductase